MAEITPSGLASRISIYLTTKSNWWAGLPGNVRGGIWMLCAAFVFTIMVSLIKVVGQRLHIAEILFFRQIIMLTFIAPVIIHNFPDILKTSQPKLHAARICFAALAMLMGFSAFIFLPLADATTIGFAKSFFTTIFAIIFLKEVVGVRRWVAMVLGFVGVVVVLSPGVGGELVNIYGLMALTGAACAAMVMIIIRVLSRTDKPITLLAYQGVGVGLLVMPLAIYYWQTPTLPELVLLMIIGGVSIFAQMGNILAFRAGEASSVAPVEYVRLIYAVAIGFFAFGHWPDARVFIGAGIIIGAAVYTIHRESRLGKKQASVDRVGTGGLR